MTPIAQFGHLYTLADERVAFLLSHSWDGAPVPLQADAVGDDGVVGTWIAASADALDKTAFFFALEHEFEGKTYTIFHAPRTNRYKWPLGALS